MRQSELIAHFRSEAQLADFARACADHWRQLGGSLTIALRGDLGTGKTTWTRALLRGLGYAGRVPSPTYTLVEHYEVGELHVVHLDLYRLAAETELENLGVRDWLVRPQTWLVVEWPERAPRLLAAADVVLDFTIDGPEQRTVALRSQTAAGAAALAPGLSSFMK